MVAPTYNPRVWKVGAEGEGGVQGDPWLHSQFEASIKMHETKKQNPLKIQPPSHNPNQTKPKRH